MAMGWKPYHTQFANEKYLYKFLSKDNLDSFLKTGDIWFSRADVFGDKMECVSVSDLIQPKPDFEKIKARQKRYLISCWHLASRESLVLWDTYSYKIENRRVFAMRFERIELLYLLKQYFIKNHFGSGLYYDHECIHGKIVYKNLIGKNFDQLSQTTVKYPSFRKEAAFAYENEYRFVIRFGSTYSYHEMGYDYSLTDAQHLPFNIIINPLLENEQYFSLKEHVEKMGYGEKLRQSDLAKWLHPELW